MDRVLIVEVYTPPAQWGGEGRYSIERMEGGRTGGPWPKDNVRVLGVQGDYCRTAGCREKASHVVIYTSVVMLGSRMETLACPAHTEVWLTDGESHAATHPFE